MILFFSSAVEVKTILSVNQLPEMHGKLIWYIRMHCLTDTKYLTHPSLLQ
jgi:hypothetical protein